MKVMLDKEIRLQSATAYLRFKKEVQRDDIQAYLKGKHFSDSLIENRVKTYLKNIGVFDENYQLTSLGNEVKGNGMLPTPEEGKYKVWFTQRDSHFGNKIFYFKRIQPNRDNRNERKLEVRFDKDEHFYLPTKNNSFGNLEVLPIMDYFGEKHGDTDQIFLRWTWEGLQKSEYVFKGQLGIGNDTITIEPVAITCEEDLEIRIKDLLSDWDDENQRLKVSFSDLDPQSRRSFELLDERIRWNDFDVKFQKIPLMPRRQKDAEDWRNWLVVGALQKEYLSPNEFERVVIKANEQDAFAPFTRSFNQPEPASFSKVVEGDTLAFWHLNAPLDLNPNAKAKLTDKPVQLKKGIELSFNEIVSRLDLRELEGSGTLIYYDKYVINRRQQQSVVAFLKATKCPTPVVITDLKHENSDDYIKRNHAHIELKDLRSIFKSKPPHDRYIIVRNNKGVRIWNISNSIDYIRFDEEEIDCDSKGSIAHSVVFTPIGEEMVEKDLLNILQDEMNDEK